MITDLSLQFELGLEGKIMIINYSAHVYCKKINNINRTTSASATVWLNDLLLITFRHQWHYMAQRNNLNQALDTQTIIISAINSQLVLVFS